MSRNAAECLPGRDAAPTPPTPPTPPVHSPPAEAVGEGAAGDGGGGALCRLPVAVLVERAQAGSVTCFAEIVRRFESRLFNFLLRRTGSAADAEDLTQETFVRAYERIDRYDPRWQISTWLFVIARLGAVTHLRKRSRDHAARRSGRLVTARDHGDPRAGADDRDRGRLLWEIADRVLGDTQRTALWLRYAEDLSIGQIAAVLGKTPIAVRVALCRARRTLAAYDEGSAQTSRRSQTAAGGLRSPVKPRSTNTSLEMRYVELDSP